MINNKKAFSFVELIISISIIVLLSVIAYTAYNSNNQKANNSKTLASITTIKNALSNYLEEKSSLPEPNGNKNYFKKDSSYAHHTGDNAFGVYGSVTQKTLPKKYLDTTPLDPVSNHYFSYGKTLDNKYFEVAGVLRQNDKAQTRLDGTYPGEYGPISLIREYNGPHFLVDDSQTHLPYNPDEHKLIAKDQDGKIYYPNSEITNTQKTLTLYFSDGSVSELHTGSTLKFSELKYKNPENNLLTTVKLFLSSGEIYTKATALNSDSDFEIYTSDTTAAVRGTIFSVKYENGKTTVSVLKGEVEVQTKNNTPTNLNLITPGTGKIVSSEKQTENNTTITAIDSIIKNKLENFADIKNIESLPKGKNWVSQVINSNSNGNSSNSGNGSGSGDGNGNGSGNGNGNGNGSGNQNLSYCTSYGTTNSVNYNCTCETGKSKFKINGKTYCEEKLNGMELYAFAPYDTAGDLSLYKKDGGTFSKNSKYINYNCSFPHYDKNCSKKASNFGAQSYNKAKSFVTYSNGTKGIYIDKLNSILGFNKADFLKYSGLNLGNDFVIELSVKGSDLKRNNGYYNLFDLGGTKLYLFPSKYLKIYYGNKTYNKLKIINNDYNSNNFYNIIIKYNNGKYKIKLGNKTSTTIRNNSINNSSNNIFLGSTSNKDFQWNGIINFFKIYK